MQNGATKSDKLIKFDDLFNKFFSPIINRIKRISSIQQIISMEKAKHNRLVFHSFQPVVY